MLADLADATDLAARLGGTFVPTDVSDERAVAALMSREAGRRGRIDVAVNNAGITGEAPLAEADAGEFERMIRVNMMSVVFGLKHAAPHMTAGGSVINTSSLAGLTGFPTYGAYAASKAAIVSLTQVAAMEYGPFRIRVNAICPSSVDTPMLAAQPGGAVEAAVARIASPGQTASSGRSTCPATHSRDEFSGSRARAGLRRPRRPCATRACPRVAEPGR